MNKAEPINRSKKRRMRTGRALRANANLAWLCVNLCLALLLLGVLRAQAQFTNYWRLHSFGTTNLAGANPEGTLIQCRDGFIYGVTSHGGIPLSLPGKNHGARSGDL